MSDSTRTIPLFVLGAFALGAVFGAVFFGSATGPESAVPTGDYVTGIGGVFFRAEDPEATRQWYWENLGIEGEGPGVNYFWREPDDPELFGFTVWSVFPRSTDYFGPGDQQFMINYRVRDLDALLAHLETRGVARVGEIEEYWYGRFAWVVDGDGNRIELWEPVYYSPDEFERRASD